jgi:predicted ArsR family transcriptional regulator
MEPMGDDEQGDGLGPTRRRVLGLLQDATRPMTANAVGDALGLHPNSVRFHLDALAAEGHVVRDREPRSAPGRPSVTYAASPAAPEVARRRYPLLARVLAAFLDDQLADPAATSEQVGRTWSRSLPLTARSTGRSASEAEALDVLTGSLEEVGFESAAVEDDGGLRIEVSHCPFLEVAADHEDVVCALHLGLMRGVLEQVGAPLEVLELEPLVEPGLCLARLSR